MLMRSALIVSLATLIVARFGEEKGKGAIAAIASLGDFGKPGEAATLSGQSIQFLLAAANPCDSREYLSNLA